MTRPRRILAWISLVVVVALIALAGLLVGGAPSIGPAEALSALAAGRSGSGTPGLAEVLVFEIRLPRVVLLALAGAALATAGAALQSALQNPLAAPGLLGVSSGASLGAVVAYASGAYLAWAWAVPLFAFLGALAALLIVLTIAHGAGRPTTGTLILTGVAVSSLLSALVSLVLLATAEHRVHEIFAWLLGSAENRTWEHVGFAAPFVLAGLAGLMLSSRLVDALGLGEEQALGIGVDLVRGRALVLGLVALVSGGAVCVVGPIAFVGLMVPHMARSVAGAGARRLLPATALAGAGFLVLSDLVARALSRGVEIPVGVLTAIFGVVFFLALLNRVRRG